MRRGLRDPLEGEIQTSGDTSATFCGHRSSFFVLMWRGLSEPRGGENQTVGYTSQNAGYEGLTHRGLLEPLEGEIQTSGDTSATSWGHRSNFCGLMPKA